MTVVWVDGFDLYDGTNAKLSHRYADTSADSSTGNHTGRFTGSKSVQLNFGITSTSRLTVPVSSGDNWSVGVAVNPQGVNSLAGITAAGDGFIYFMNGATVIAKLGIKSNGSLICGRADFTTNVIGAASATGILTVGNFTFIEAEFTRNGSTGVFNVYANGALILSNTGANTGASSIDNIALQNPSGSDGVTVDDWYIASGATRLGECRVQTLMPSADTATKQWAASTGTNHAALVDEIPSNGDSDYIFDSTVGNKDLFDVADLADIPLTIHAVQPLIVARKDDATLREIRTNMKNGSTTTNGTTRTMGSGYKIWADPLQLVNPDTAAAWTVSNINAMQLGVETVT